MKKILSVKVIAIILIVILLSSYVIYQSVLLSKSELQTQFALNETVYKSIDTKCFVIRDEKFITDNTNGTTVSFAKNGERVSTNDIVSVVFETPDDAASFLEISEIESDIAHYQNLSGQVNFQTVNIDSLLEKIDNELIDFLEYRDKGDFSESVEAADAFRDSLTGKQIATGSDVDFSEQLVSLQNKLTELKNNEKAYTEIKSDSSGYFINGSDGYENVIKFSEVDELSVSAIEKAINTTNVNPATDVAGRIVGSFTWYIACVVDSDDVVNIADNSEIYVNFPYHGIEKLPVTVHKIGNRNAEKSEIILSCDLMNADYADLRIEDVQIITEEYTGYKIANSAIRTVNNEKGVYVVRGNLLGFRKVHILYSTDTYSIVDNPEGESDYIKLYDKVVTEGVELYDNKLV